MFAFRAPQEEEVMSPMFHADAGHSVTPSIRESSAAGRAECPVCGGPLFEIRAKLQCAQCHTICETCCEGGRG
jgi:hypothetical protein